MYFVVNSHRYEVRNVGTNSDGLLIFVIEKPSDVKTFVTETQLLTSLTIFKDDGTVFKTYDLVHIPGFAFEYA